MDIKKCDQCGRVETDEDDPKYEWWSVEDGLGAEQVGLAELCSKECIIGWVDGRIEARAEFDKELAKSTS